MRSSMAMQRLVNQFGQEVTLRKPAYGAYDPATGSVGTGTSTDYTVKCYMAEFDLSEVNNDNVVRGDRKALLPARDTSGTLIPEPDAEDSIVGFGDTVKVIAVQTIYHGDYVACYICQVRE